MAQSSFGFKSNKPMFEEDLKQQVRQALEAMGLLAEGYAVANITAFPRVDTGRLRASITHATTEYNGKGSYSDDQGNGYADASAQAEPDEDYVYIGTNVEYAPYVELGTYKMTAAHYMKNAIANHKDEYKEVAEKYLKGQS